MTLLVAGLIALVQVDIKRVIAYSTMSQIGYMFVGAGIGAYSAAMFHLMAHAFFKALLFLAAGIIIHALSGEQDMRRMGGLRKVLPHTRTAFLIGSLALVGLPPLAGFFSKDAIIDATLARGDWFGYLLFAGCLVGTFLTGLYAFRLYFIVFYGEQSAFAQEHLHKPQGPARGAALDGLDGHHPRRPLGDRRASCSSRRSGTRSRPGSTRSRRRSPSRRRPRTRSARSPPSCSASPASGSPTAATSRRRIRIPKPVKLFEKKFYFDELYDAVFYKPADLISRGLGRFFEIPVIAGSIGEITQGFRFGSGEVSKVQNGLVRVYVARARERSRRPRRRLHRVPMSDWLTTILIVLPFAGALVVWLLPLPKQMVGVARDADRARRGRRSGSSRSSGSTSRSGGLQFGQQHSWFSEINSSYHVGLFAFSLWLVGLTAICGAVACMYAWWAGRERSRAYFGLMLFLTGSVVGVFASQDLLLFYAFFEAMLIPLYVLIGVWGGPGRLRATITFIVYTVAGSLLMLAAIIVYGLQQNSFDLLTMAPSTNDWLFLGFAIAFAVKAPFWPFHGWLPDAYRESPPEVSGLLSGVISKVAAFGFLRIVLVKFPGPSHDFRVPILVLCAIGLVYGSLLAFRAPDVRGVIAYSSLAQMGLIGFGLFAFNSLGLERLGAADGQPRAALDDACSCSPGWSSGAPRPASSRGSAAWPAAGRRSRPMLMTVGVMALAVPLSSNFAGEFLILAGVFQQGWGWAVVGAIAIVLAAMYMLRLISAVLHEDVGPSVDDAALDLRTGELAVVVPLVAILLVLSAWPNAISGHSFGGEQTARRRTSEAIAP